MRTSTTIGLLFLAGASLASAPSAKEEKAASSKFKLIRADELAAMLADKSRNVALFDANDSNFRKKEGVIPGARLLSSFSKYDVAQELPKEKDTPLVFYCANTH
ncbi:MAG TPA: rhodanese-like domain-containing protein [Myxococcaceae bacterium]|nr:rhodanese-like domain-containing protein [Myxococcaceae bacterium]